MGTYKPFVRPHLDCGDAIFDDAYNESFHQKAESIQYNACQIFSGAISGTFVKIRYGTPPTSTFVQETLPLLLRFSKVMNRVTFQSITNK